MKQFIAIILIALAFLTACKSKQIQEQATHDQMQQTTDSVSRLEVRTTKSTVVPQSTAKLNLDPAVLAKLPQGAKFESKQGNATASAAIAPDGTIEITANCDSLIILTENLQIEVHRLKTENTALKTTLNRKEKIGLSGWQIFQIYGFRVFLVLTALYLLIKYIKRNKLTIWKK